MELTEIKFWENYWLNCKLPCEVDYEFSFDRCLANALKNNMPNVKGEVFEIGCAPGKWLAFMAKEYRLHPCGLEYTDVGMKATVENFKMLGIIKSSISAGDIFQFDVERQYDVVMSFGFIEHFMDADDIVNVHLRHLKPGGILILGVPNFGGIYSFVQSVLDKEILDKHNLDIMNLNYFRELAISFSLKTVFLNYIGSFEPALPISKFKYGNPLQIFVKSLIWIARRLRKYKFFDAVNHRYFSSYILAIYQKSQ